MDVGIDSVVGKSVVAISSSMEVTVLAVTLSLVSSGPMVDVATFETVDVINEPVDDDTSDDENGVVELLPDDSTVVFLT